MEMTGQPSAGRSVDASGAIPSRISASIDRKIDNGEFYDAHQLVRTMFFRFVTRQEFSQAVAICRVYALKFAELKQEPLAVDLATMMLKAFEDRDAKPTDKELNQIVELFSACAAAEGNGRDKYKFINRALKWSRSPETPHGDARLHRVAAEAYWREKQYGLCQGHLLFCRDPEALAQMLRDWETLGYLSERPFFSLRLVFILLCMKDVETAEKVLVQGGTGQDWDSAEVPAPLQLAYLLVCACKFKSEKLFNLLKQKYHLVLRRDETFSKYMDEIEKRVLGRIRKPNPGFASLLSSFMGTGVDD